MDSDTKNGYKALAGFLVIVFLYYLLISGDDSTSDDSTENSKYLSKPLSFNKQDSLNFAANMKKLKLDEDQFKKTKAGKIYKKHPNWSREDCERLSKKQIWIGMEYEMLVYLRGRPNHVNTSNYGNGDEYQACWDNYDPGCFYFDETQIIKSYN